MQQLPAGLPALSAVRPLSPGRLSPSRVAPYGGVPSGVQLGPPRAYSPPRAVSPLRATMAPPLPARAPSARSRASRAKPGSFPVEPGVPCPPGSVLVANGRVRECHPAIEDKRTRAYKEAHGLRVGPGSRGGTPRAPSAGRAPRAPSARARTPRERVQTIPYTGGAPNVNAKYNPGSQLPEVPSYYRWGNKYASGYKPESTDRRALGLGGLTAAGEEYKGQRAQQRGASPRTRSPRSRSPARA